MSRTREFTEKNVKAAQIGFTHVTGIPRLYLVKTDKGVTRYEYRYSRPQGPRPGKKSPVTITAVGKPGITLLRAKEIAAHYAGFLRDGIDPQEAKGWTHRDEMTFGKLADQYFEDNKHRWSEKQLNEARLLVHGYGKKLTPLRMAQITSEAVRDVMKPLLKTKPRQAQRAREWWKLIIDYAIALRMYAGPNPADWKKVQKFLFPGYVAPPRGHFAGLPVERVPQLFRELRQRDGMDARALEILLLTLLRTRETLGARWPEINWDNKVWTVPGPRMKNGVEFQVPLSDRAIAFLRRLQERATNEFVFTGYKRYQPLSEKSMLLLIRRIGITKKESTIHGLRATFRSWAQRMPFDQIAAEICSSHTMDNDYIKHLLPFDPRVLEAYNRDKLLDKRRPIMAAWAAYCESGISPVVDPVASQPAVEALASTIG